LEGKYYQDLDAQGEPEKLTLHRVPRITLNAQRHVGNYVLGEFDSGFDNYQRESGTAGVRLDLRPGFTLPLPLGPYGFGSVRTSLRETAYHLTETDLSGSDPEAMSPEPMNLDRTQTRETVEVAARVGTALTRVYDVERWGLAKLQHTIEPAFEYFYVPSVSQDEQPFFDSIDRINRRNLVTYGVASRFLGKFDADEDERDDVREIGRLWLVQGYDISRRIARVDDTEEESTADHFSDIDFGGRVNPSRDFSLRFRTQYDARNNEISATNIGFFVVDPREYLSAGELQELANRTSVGVSYRFLTANRLQEINSSLVLRLTDWVGFIYASRYDLVENRFLDNHFGLRFVSPCDCWAFEIAVTDRTNPNEIEARAQLTLLGLGSVGGGRSDEGMAERLR
jgi:LPS-assembly protein